MTDPLPPPLPKAPRDLLVPAVILGLTPSVLAILVVMIGISGINVLPCCAVAAILSLGCCTASSILIFKRNTTTAIVFGVLLAMVNVFIAIGFGCTSLLGNLTGH